MGEWTALLEGAPRDRALRVADELLEALLPFREMEDVSLADGKAGLALLFAEVERSRPGGGHAAAAESLLQDAADALAERPLPPGLYGGFSGIAWAAERLRSVGIPPFDMDELDEALLGLLSRRPWRGLYDLVAGLTGLGLYALERCPRPTAGRCLEALVDRLEERAERAQPGATWWTAAEQLPPHQRVRFPEGYYNLGAAHGVPSVVALLALIAREGVAEARARALAADGARWVLANRLPPGAGGCFPMCVAPGIAAEPSRAAWCYGDPGVALCLLVAARALADAALERTALEIARDAARRPPEQCGVMDAGLCHGAAGLGHLFNRLYQASGDPLLAEAATAWLTRALDMRRPGEGVGGYLTWTRASADQAPGWVPDVSLLNGTTGIALALLSACYPLTPIWDGVLMASIPATARP